jgi:hypothetical protein
MNRNLWTRVVLALAIFLLASQAIAQENSKKNGLILLPNLGVSLESHYIMLNIPDKLQTVKAHPADSSTGATTTNLTDSYGFALKINLRAYFLTFDDLYFFAGTDLGFILANNQYRQGIYNTELCDYGGESYAFTQLVPSYFSVTPVIGLRYNFIILEASFPYTGFELRNGHDRWGSWDEVNHYSWQGFGQRYYLGLNFGSFHPGVYYENYNMNFDGHQAKISNLGISLAYYLL